MLAGYLERIAVYDSAGIRLDAVVVQNPRARADAEAADARRASGQALGPLDGIPYTAKDSYLARGLTAAARSPAFADLFAQHDAGRWRHAALPYGRAESPYNAAVLLAAFGSGSSNGSGTATAASLCAFGLGGGVLVVGPRSGMKQCALRIHTDPRRHLHARWLTPGVDDGCGCAAYQDDVRHVRGSRRHRRRRPEHRRRCAASHG